MNLFNLAISCLNKLQPLMGLSVRNYAARKGTRAKRAKSKVKVEIKKVGFIPHNQRNREAFLASRPTLKFDDSWKRSPIDNVYPTKYYKMPLYLFQEALQYIRENNHPDMYNMPQANLHLTVELNMEGEKRTRLVDNFHRIVAIPHHFEHGEDRRVIAFTKDEELKNKVLEEGATLAGGVELIKEIQNGSVSLSDFQHYIADPLILPELVVLRGVMKRRFPNVAAGTLDVDLKSVVNRLVKGIYYSALKDEFEKEFGFIETMLGTLDMNGDHLEANFEALINDVFKMKPKKEGSFISRCLLWSPPRKEKFRLNHEKYLNIIETQTNEVEEEPVETSCEKVSN